MARDDQSWNTGRSGRPSDEPDSDHDMRDRYMRDRDMRQGFSRPWSGPTGGAWGSGSRSGESTGQRSFGQYSRESNQGSDLGRARNYYGDTGGDNYGGGGFGGYGGSSGFWPGGGDQGGWGQNHTSYDSAWRQSGNMSGDMSNAQSHAGRGPKGWKRSDDRIHEDVNEQLERHHHIDASDIEVRVEDGEVILSGYVNDRREKRLAEDVVESISGVRDVQNQIRVKRDERMASGQADGQTTSDTAGTSSATSRSKNTR